MTPTLRRAVPTAASSLRRGAAIALVAFSLAAPGAAQTGDYALAVRDVSVAEALDRLVTLTGIDLVFSSDVTRGRRAFCQISDAAPEAILRCIVESAGLDFYRLSSGTYVVIRRPVAPAVAGHLSGVVVDEASGTPVAFAVVESADGAARAVSNADGFFSLPALPPGDLEVVIRRLGYRPARAEVRIAPEAGVRRRFAIVPTVVEMEPIIVNGVERRLGRGALGTDVLDDADGERASGTPNGVALSAGRSVGVARAPFFADLHIQGGRSGEHLVRIDGAPVFEPVSLGRVLGAFSPLAVRRLTVRKAGFSASDGSLIGGAVDVEHAPARGGSPGVTVMADPYAVNGRVRVPFEIGDDAGALLVAGRTSLWDVFRERSLRDALQAWNIPDPVLLRSVVGDGEAPTDRLEFEPRSEGSELSFSDIHVAADVPIGSFRGVEASFYRGSNDVGSELFASGLVPGELTNPLLLSRDAYRWSNTAGQVGFRALVGDRASVNFRLRASLHGVDHAYDMIYGDEGGYVPDGVADLDTVERALRDTLDARPGAWDGSESSEWAAEGRFDYSIASGNLLSGGVELLRVRSRVQLEGPYYRPIRSVSDQWRWVAWLEDRWIVGRDWTIEPGVRVTGLDAGGGVFAEPRLAVRLDRADGANGPWSARLAGGVYRQFTNRFELTTLGPSALVPGVQFWLPVDRSLDVPRAFHLAGEFVWSPGPAWEIRAEGYHKWLDHLLDLDYPSLLSGVGDAPEGLQAQSEFIGSGNGRAWGGGARVTRATEALRWQLGYDFAASERTFPGRFEGERQPAPWLEPHRVYAGFDTSLGHGWSVRADGRGVWGRRWGLRRSYYDALALGAAADGPDVGRPGEDRLPALIDLDLAVGWSGRIGPTAIEVRGELRNALDRDNVLDLLLRRTLDDESSAYSSHPRTLPGRAALVTLRLSR
ncbi:MAG: carboxypeptidase-like regulatory domain-containing protein [Gemmatimonadetes bacterium]|nr:carboxypeptidase-like regulatory domain-containing protein [Gemmatimonadota bacterium]